MDDIRSIEELIRAKKLTEEELEMHRELIEECREREAKIAEYSGVARKQLEALTDQLNGLTEKAQEFETSMQTLMDSLATLQLTMLPEESFYRE